MRRPNDRAFVVFGLGRFFSCQAREGGAIVSDAKPFAVVLPPDPLQLEGLRRDIEAWLAHAGVERKARADVVLATHEVAASAMGSPGDVYVDAAYEESAVTVVVASSDGWTSPDDDLGGRRMKIVRQLVKDVAFERSATGPRLRFRKPL